MREYGKLHSTFWSSQTIQSLTDDGRTLAAYLITSPHTSMLGCFRLPDGYVADDLRWSFGRVSEAFANLSEKGFATRDEVSKWVFIHMFLKWNQFENPNVVKAAEKLFLKVPDDCGVKPLLARSMKEWEPRFKAALLNPFLTLSEPYRKPEPEPEPQPEPKPEPEPTPFPAAVPAPGEKKAKKAAAAKGKGEAKGESTPDTSAAWAAYAEAYEVRYGTPPVRNATVNAQLLNFVKRVPREEAPHIARFYVAHNNRFYVQKGHSVGAMTLEAEKLRTEWATQRQVTAAEAAQVDRTQTNMNAFGPLIAEAQAREAQEAGNA